MVGVVLSAGVARLLSGMLYEVSALDPLAFLLAPAVLAAASLVATYVPARRAASVAPVSPRCGRNNGTHACLPDPHRPLRRRGQGPLVDC